MKNRVLAFCISLAAISSAEAQNVGIGTTSPGTKLHVAGAIASTPNTDVAAASVTIPDNTSIFRLSATAGTQANALTMSSPTEGQILTIYNEDGDPATFASQTIAASGGVASFEYINGGWRFVSSNQTGGGGGSYINNGTSQQTSASYNIDGSGLLSGTGSQSTIGTGTASTANGKYELTMTPNATISSGINISLSSPSTTAYGVNISAGSASVNGILVSNSTSSTSSSVYNVGGVLSSTNIVSGYNAYRNGSGLTYGLYGINGTTASYATNANTWAAFLQGRTVISSESSPSSPVGTDLEVRNTTTGAGAPATVSIRQTTALATSGNVLGNLNFGDNYVTTPQAQIQVLRDAAASSTSDMPTAMTFWTTPDASSTLTERMRISQAGTVGINSTTTTTERLTVTGGTLNAIAGTTTSTSASSYGVLGNSTGASGTTIGTAGQVSSAAGTGIIGSNLAASGTGAGTGVQGTTSQSAGFGVWGANANSSGTGVVGAGNNVTSNSLTAGSGGAFSGSVVGVYGYGTSTAGSIAIYGQSAATAGMGAQVFGNNQSTGFNPNSAGAGGNFTGSRYGSVSYASNQSSTGTAYSALATYASNWNVMQTSVASNTSLYHFAVQGASNDFGSGFGLRTGGVIGREEFGGAWSCLGYQSSTSTNRYGVFYTAAGTGTGYLPSGNIQGIGIGGTGGVIGSWTRGQVMGQVSCGELFANYNLGNSYTSGHQTDIVTVGDKRVAAYSMTSTDLKVYNDGTSALNGGNKRVNFDESFAKLIGGNKPVVTVSPMGACNGLYIKSIDATGFEVAELNNGNSNVEFSYILIGRRVDASEASEVPADLLKRDFDENMKGVMFNENNLEQSGKPIWWDGQKVRFDEAPAKRDGLKPLPGMVEKLQTRTVNSPATTIKQ